MGNKFRKKETRFPKYFDSYFDENTETLNIIPNF